MVLGIRSKSRKSVSIQVHYIIHVQEIKPWPPSQSLRSVQSVLLKWENGDQISGSLASTAATGKIEFDESFRLSVLMSKEVSKKGKHRENFQKNCLEFYLYDKTVKSQLLASATINFADFGIIKETKTLSILLNCKKSFRNSSQPFLYVNIQPIDTECSSSSSPSSSLSKELSVEKEGSESVSQSVNDDEHLEIASFTDDDVDDIPSNTFQTIRSASEITGDSNRISRGTKGSHGEFVQPSESTTSSLLGNTEGETSTQFSGIKFPSSSMVPSSDVGNATNDRPLLPKISEENIKLGDANSEIQESMQLSSASNISSSMKPNFELEKVSSVSNTGVMEDKGKTEEGRKVQKQFTTRNELLENEPINNLSDDCSTKKGKLNGGAFLLNKKSHEHPKSVFMNDKTEDITNVMFPQQSAQNCGQFISKQTHNQAEEINIINDVHGGSTKKGKLKSATLLLNKKLHEHPTGSFRNDRTEDATNVKFPQQPAEHYGQFISTQTHNQEEEIDTVNDVHIGSTKKGKLKSATLLLNKKLHEHPTSIFWNDKTENVANVRFPQQSAENYGQFISAQTGNQEEGINTINDVHVGTACHEDDNVNVSFPNIKTELKAEVEMLQEELREAASLEVSMYSVIAEHGSSSNKVHAPARRLSRFYFHVCRVGSPATKASAAQSAVSGFVLVSKACGNDVPRLTFWFSNLILLRGIVSKGVQNINFGDGPCINSECDLTGKTLDKEEKDNTEKHFHSWEDPETFLVALERLEAWIFSRIVESVWWQTLTPYMQSAAAKSSSSRKAYEKRYRVGDQDQGSFSIDLWKRAFKDACERLCPLRAGGHECGCLPVIARLVMEQLVSRLDVAMFNAILRESAEEMPMDPISDPISDSKVLPIPAGKSCFGSGAQLKNAIGDWSRWLSDLFSIDDSDSLEVSNENHKPKCESSFKPFQFLNALSDLMMLPLDMLADGSMRKEVCPRFGTPLIKRVVNNFVPDEFSPGPIPDAVVEALNEDAEGSITSFPCSAGSAFYAPPPASSVVGMLQEVGTKTSLRSGSFALKKLYTSDDELDELDSPLSALGMDDSSLSSKEKFALVNGCRKVVRYELLREVWKSSE